jgi:hypothetical protein
MTFVKEIIFGSTAKDNCYLLNNQQCNKFKSFHYDSTCHCNYLVLSNVTLGRMYYRWWGKVSVGTKCVFRDKVLKPVYKPKKWAGSMETITFHYSIWYRGLLVDLQLKPSTILRRSRSYHRRNRNFAPGIGKDVIHFFHITCQWSKV